MIKLRRVLSETVAVTKQGTVYSSPFRANECAGTIALLIVSSAGSLTVTQQCGLTEDGTFYDPVNAANSALGAVCAAGFTVGSRFINLTPVVAPWLRLKMIEANVAATDVDLDIYEVIDN